MSQKVLFSEVRGVVVRDGVPVSGAQVHRRYKWGEKSGSDTTATDASGAFHLAEMYGKSFLGFLPGEVVIDQTIDIVHEGKTYEAWVFFKRNYDPNGEMNGKPLKMRCDLAVTPARTETGPGGEGYFGMCRLE